VIGAHTVTNASHSSKPEMATLWRISHLFEYVSHNNSLDRTMAPYCTGHKSQKSRLK
jgi:hypothetical protein